MLMPSRWSFPFKIRRLGAASFWWRYFKMISDMLVSGQARGFTIPAPTTIDAISVTAGYKDVRSDLSDTKWAVFKYLDNEISLAASGETFDDFKTQFADDERCYGYIRIQTGDEMSKRTKFVLLTWVGPRVGVMNRAKITNDKALVKQVITSYAIEFQLESQAEMDEDIFRTELFKIGGTHYGTGTYTEDF